MVVDKAEAQSIKNQLSHIACVASVSVGLGSNESQRNGIFGVFPARKMVREPKRGKRGRGRGRKETLADKPLDFENRLLDLSCLSAHTKISCCRPKQRAHGTENISINPSDQCSF